MVRIVAWNAQWASAGGRCGDAVRRVLTVADADVIALTEAAAGLLPDGGHVLDGGPDWGYAVPDELRRKVLLWSRRPWFAIDEVGDTSMPSGRFVSATTETRLGHVRVVGVCVPWSRAHVSTGRRDRSPWEDHLRFLGGLAVLLDGSTEAPMIVAGDFNQRIPRTSQPVHVADALGRALAGFDVVTSGEIGGVRLIDHVALRGLRRVGEPVVIERRIDGGEVSDHDGVIVDLG